MVPQIVIPQTEVEVAFTMLNREVYKMRREKAVQASRIS